MSDLQDILSVFIPTYNRATKLRELLDQLNSINYNYCCVNVIDNCSEDNTKEIVDSFYQILNYPLNYQRNEVNVGLSGNLIKCIENCKTDWLWIIGDDDLIESNAFKTLSEMNLGLITDETIYINYSTKNLCTREGNFFSVGLDDFVLKLDSFSNFVFISSSIINVKLLKKYLRYAYSYSNTLVPHISIILSGLNEKNFKVIFSKQIISIFRIPSKDEKWSYFNYYLNAHTLLDFLSKSSNQTYSLFRKKIYKTIILDSNYLNSILLNKGYNLIFKKYLFNNVFFKSLKSNKNVSIKERSILFLFYFIVNYAVPRYYYIKRLHKSSMKTKSGLSFQPLNTRI